MAHYRPEYPSNAPGILGEIKRHPEFKDKPVELRDIFNDLAHIQRHAGQYLAMEFLPNLALEYQEFVNLSKYVVAESLRRYREGDTETQMRESDKGTINTVIHKEGGHQWLVTALEAKERILKVGEQGPVVKEAHRIMQDYKRLLDLEKKGVLPVAIENKPTS